MRKPKQFKFAGDEKRDHTYIPKWKNEDAKIPVTPSFVLGTHQTVFSDSAALHS